MVPDARTIAWIFHALALASATAPATFAGIASVADGINHAVPTHHELSKSLRWLNARGLVESRGRAYALTATGRALFEQADGSTTMLRWSNLTSHIQALL